MNLSEIRKKAQQEKEEGMGGGAAPLVPETPSQAPPAMEAVKAVEVVEAVETLAEAPLPQDRGERPPLFLTATVQAFDPLAVILAGRAAARGDAGTETAASLMEPSGEEYQELLCFRVAGEKYAVDIMEIKEIIKPREVTEVPRVPSYVSGVLSLRGVIIPVIDMHKRLGHDVTEGSGRERIIVVKKGEEFFGVMVDEVIQVARIAPGEIEPPPAVLDEIDRDFVSGIGRFDGEMLILLNLGKVLDINLH
ncbi:MAG TPA: chemotaxis protein CheW [Geobacteraceae bacterium]